MNDPTNCISSETFRVVEKIRAERWVEAQRLHARLGWHIQVSLVNAPVAAMLAERLHEVSELDAVLTVLR